MVLEPFYRELIHVPIAAVQLPPGQAGQNGQDVDKDILQTYYF